MVIRYFGLTVIFISVIMCFMDMQRINEFITIVREGSFKNAACKLGISPSVLSERFRVFEKSLNTTLIERGSHCIRLTQDGDVFLKNAEELLYSYKRIASALYDMKGQQTGRLRLQLCQGTLPARLEREIISFCNKNPRLSVNLYDSNYCTVSEGLLSNLTDIAFAFGRENDYREIPGRIIYSRYTHMTVCLPKNHRLSKRETIYFSDLNNETFILYPKMIENSIRDLELFMLRKSGIRFSVYESDVSPGLIELLVSAGQGICFGTWLDHKSDNTVLVPLTDSGYDIFLYILYLEKNRTDAISDFIKEFHK